MENVVLVIHVLIALAIIGLILLQQGKGAEAGASFGAGASATMFGSAGSWNFFSRLTAILATLFFITSFTLAVIAKKSATSDADVLPELEQVKEAPVETEVPELKEESKSDVPEIPETDKEQK